jgi:3'-5' exoribonuclease
VSSYVLKSGMRVEKIFAVRKLETKTSKNGKPYLDIIFFDKNNEISAKLWDVNGLDTETLRKSLFLFVKGNIETYNASLQIRVEELMEANPTDEELDGLIETAPVPPQRMFEKIIEVLTALKNQPFRELGLAIYMDRQKELLYFPAAKSFHHSMKSGLLYHTYSMLRAAAPLCSVYAFLNKDLLFAGVALHDIGKLVEMDSAEYGMVRSYTDEGRLLGHITSGIVLIDRYARGLGTPERELLLLKHMILSHHGISEYGSPKPPMIAEAEALNFLDMLDSRMNIFEKALSQTKAGEFSAKSAALDQREIYSHSLGKEEPNDI